MYNPFSISQNLIRGCATTIKVTDTKESWYVYFSRFDMEYNIMRFDNCDVSVLVGELLSLCLTVMVAIMMR